ncbi:MAG: hypothetical protein RR854_00070 [Muribaculaceae bacterium]
MNTNDILNYVDKSLKELEQKEVDLEKERVRIGYLKQANASFRSKIDAMKLISQIKRDAVNISTIGIESI